MMKLTVGTIILSTLCLTMSTNAVDMQETPVQSGLQTALAQPTIWTDNRMTAQLSMDRAAETSGSPASGEKSIFRAGLYSLVVPGWGQYYNDSRTKAKLFFAAEALTWIAFASFRTYGNWKKDDYILFGNSRAGAQLDDKNDGFLTLLEQYDDLEQYNSLGLLLDAQASYIPDTPANHWDWQSTEDRVTYTILRRDARSAYKRADWMIVLAVVNRVVSVVDAVRGARRSQQTTDDSFPVFGGVKYRLEIDPMARTRQIQLTLFPGF